MVKITKNIFKKVRKLKYITGDVYFKKEKVDIYPYLSFNAETDICIIGGGIYLKKKKVL